ncbi:MAG TPA: hypothetical protein DDX75_13365 [Phycisphaerales bacterium]|nr:hypothetical protein [Phycisphaerales bacterium]
MGIFFRAGEIAVKFITVLRISLKINFLNKTSTKANRNIAFIKDFSTALRSGRNDGITFIQLLEVIFIVSFLICYSFLRPVVQSSLANDTRDEQKPIWTEITNQRNQNTRVWEISKWVEKKDPIANKMIMVEEKSKVIEKYKPLSEPENVILTEDEVWYSDATYYISSTITIGSGVELRIEPGTIVKFEDGAYINAQNGKLTAKGKPYEYIIFTSKYDSLMGEVIDSNEPWRGCWGGLCLSEDDCVSFCKIGYADTAAEVLWRNDANGSIENNIIYNFGTTGIGGFIDYGGQGIFRIKNNLIFNDSADESYGVYFTSLNMLNANAVISNNTIAKNCFGIYCERERGPGGNFEIINNLVTDCDTDGIYTDTLNAQILNNGFYNAAEAGDNYVVCSNNPFDTAGDYLGAHFLNDDSGGGGLLKNAGLGNAADCYAEQQNWTVRAVCDDALSRRVFTSGTHLSKDTVWTPSENFDVGAVDIGYHHSRIDYFILPGVSVNISGNSLTVWPGTVVAIGGQSQTIQCGKIISNGRPFGGRIKYMNYGLASAGWERIKYREISNGAVRPANMGAEFSFCDFTGLGYGILSGAADEAFHDNIFKNNYQGIQGNKSVNSLFVGNGIGMYHSFGADMEAINCNFERNTLYGLYVMSNPEVSYDVRNCIFRNNGRSGIYEYTWLKPGSSLAENNNAFYQNGNHRILNKSGEYSYDVLSETDCSALPFVSGTRELNADDFIGEERWDDFAGRFYLPRESDLVNGGDAGDSAMYGYTTDANCVIDDDVRDIGFHYAAQREFWVKASNAVSGDGSEDNPFNSITDIEEYSFCEWDVIHIVTDDESDSNLAKLFEVKDWPVREYRSEAVYRNGIRWTFEDERRIGQFCNGDYWALGPYVEINDVSPACFGAGNEFRNGSMLNPTGHDYQGYDGRVVGFVQLLNVGFPAVLEGINSLVSAASITDQNSWKCTDGYYDISDYCVHYGPSEFHSYLYSAAVLTSVSYCPMRDVFRPGYSGIEKKFFTKNSLKKELLPRLPLATRPSAGYLKGITKEFQNVWVDHMNGDEWPRRIHPLRNMPNFGREIGTEVSEAACLLMLDYSDEELEPLLVNFVQTGIDFYYLSENGRTWGNGGGHDNGRKWPIIFAGIMLDADEMKNVAQTGRIIGSEDSQTYHGQTKALWGRNCVSPYTETCSGTLGAKDCRDPQGIKDGCPEYRNCCTSKAWIGEAIAIKLMGVEDLWGHDAFFDYVERWYDADVPEGGEVLGGWYIRDMWNSFWPAGAIIIDNGQTGSTTSTGTWLYSSAAGPYSTGSLWSANGATYTWIFRPMETGNYRVSMWWTYAESRARSVPINIEHAEGTSIVDVNQAGNGGKWNDLGEYAFIGGAPYNVKITAPTGNPPNTSADAVKFVLLGSGNVAPRATIESITPNPALVGQQVCFAGSGTDFDGTIIAYKWESNIDGVISEQSAFSIDTLAIGRHVITFRVQDNEEQWSEPLTKTLDICDYIIDNGDVRTASMGNWQVSNAEGFYGSNSLWGHSGMIYAWAFTPAETGMYRVSMWWTAMESRSSSVPVIVQNSSGYDNVLVDQTKDGGKWNVLGEYQMEAGTAYNVIIIAPTGSPPSTCADAVKFEKL